MRTIEQRKELVRLARLNDAEFSDKDSQWFLKHAIRMLASAEAAEAAEAKAARNLQQLDWKELGYAKLIEKFGLRDGCEDTSCSEQESNSRYVDYEWPDTSQFGSNDS